MRKRETHHTMTQREKEETAAMNGLRTVPQRRQSNFFFSSETQVRGKGTPVNKRLKKERESEHTSIFFLLLPLKGKEKKRRLQQKNDEDDDGSGVKQ